jgi:hypothetical protein
MCAKELWLNLLHDRLICREGIKILKTGAIKELAVYINLPDSQFV